MGESKRSWLGILKSQEKASDSNRPSDLEGGMWSAHQRAQEGATRLIETATQLVARTTRHQVSVDAIVELACNATSRGAEISNTMDRVRVTLDRLRLVALNVGLEGARLGDPAGRALINVAEEVRDHSERGGEALHDLNTALEDVLVSWDQLSHKAEDLRQSHATIVSQVGQHQANAQQVVSDVNAVGEHARRLTDTDPETALILTQVSEHARALIQALTSLGGRVRRELIRSAIGPSLQPLLRALLDVAKGSRGEKSSND
ncbi:MAG: hypothetical protein CSA75_01890 [Sorangium cellulosum]|nr:MAG: hypothetical protein CSA75_01890 [Sorangium cellulosum]